MSKKILKTMITMVEANMNQIKNQRIINYKYNNYSYNKSNHSAALVIMAENTSQ